MTNDDELNLHRMTKLSGWLNYRLHSQESHRLNGGCGFSQVDECFSSSFIKSVGFIKLNKSVKIRLDAT